MLGGCIFLCQKQRWLHLKKQGVAKFRPIFSEEVECKISANSSKYNFLLDGDNLPSLELLLKTHKRMIDVIYIDHPYNTGKKDFVYDDAFVDKTDV